MPFPPCNKFKQWAAACDQLTTTKANLSFGSTQTWGRIVTPGTPYDAGLGGVGHILNMTSPSNMGFCKSISEADGSPSNGFTCDTTNTCYNGIQVASHSDGSVTFRRGSIWSAIKGVAKAADPNFYMLKGTGWNDAWEPGDSACGSAPGALTSWRACVPVLDEYVVQKTTPTSFRVGNAILGTAEPPDPPGEPVPSYAYSLEGYLEVYTGAPIQPDILGYLRQGSTILGAWARVRTGNLTVNTYHCEFSGSTYTSNSGSASPSDDCFSWNYNSEDWMTVETSGTAGFFVVGIRTSDSFPVMLTGATYDSAFIESNSYVWVDMTNTIKTLFENWNGPYSGFHLLPASPYFCSQLAAAAAGDGYLARLLPNPTVSATLDPYDGHPLTLEYSCDAQNLTFSSLTIDNMYISFELPATTVSTLLDYGSRPALA